MTVCWEYVRPTGLCRRHWKAAVMLATLWVVLDSLAVALGLWNFPLGVSLPVWFFGIPLEEYLLFFIHALILSLLLRLYGAVRC